MSADLKETPLVSVLMTAYNREVFIAEAIESVLASDYLNFELIIVDDCSTDKTIEIAREYESTDDRIKLYLNETNLGDYPNRNKAAQYANGKYIMYCDSDDLFFSNSISYCVSSMERFTSSGIGFYYAGDMPEPFIMDKVKLLRKHFFLKPVLDIGPGGTIINRSFFEWVGGYPVKYGPANDMYFNLKVCCETEIVFLPKLFLSYRIHEGQEKSNAYVYIYNNYRYLSDALRSLSLGLSDDEIKYLKYKSNRRFVSNFFNFFIKTKNIQTTKQLWIRSGFNFKDLITGVFHSLKDPIN